MSKRRSFPVILQSEAADCGLACIAMVVNYYGGGDDVSSLRRRFPVSLDGMTMMQVRSVLDQLHFGTTAIRFEMEYLQSISTPCILHWNMDHFVVLCSVARESITVIDPAHGLQRVPMAAASKAVTGVALECSPRPEFTRSKPQPALRLRELWRPHLGFGSTLISLVALIAMGETLALVAPYIMQLAVDRAIPTGDVGTLAGLVIAMAVLAILAPLLQLWKGVIAARTSSRVSLDIERSIFRHLLHLPSAFIERRSLGDVLSRLESVSPLQQFVSGGALALGVSMVVALLAMLVMLLYSPGLSVVPLVFLACSATVRLGSTGLIGTRTAEVLRADARERSIAIETLRSHRSIKLFSRELDRLAVWQNAVASHLRAGLKLSQFSFYLSTVLSVMAGLEGAILLFFGGLAVSQDRITIGMMVAFMAYASIFTERATSVLEEVQSFKVLRLHKSRLADIVKSPVEQAARSLFEKPRPITGVELRNVTFKYSHFSPELLRSVDAVVHPGSFVLIHGHSGGGKTTLLKLLAGLLSPAGGTLRISDMEVRSYGVLDYRSRIGVVMQDDSLLSGSVIDNVSFFDPKPDLERVVAVCEIAGIAGEIDRMPMGYRSLVGDMGSILSGGQKQRVLIARALYHDPDIVFLDEGTANLDRANEIAILGRLQRMGKTVVMVSHGEVGRSFATHIWEVRDGNIHEARVEREQTAGPVPA